MGWSRHRWPDAARRAGIVGAPFDGRTADAFRTTDGRFAGATGTAFRRLVP
jgi:hypothetical protein